MKLSRLYSNQPAKFVAIDFNGVTDDLISVVFAEIKKPKDPTKDSHNLGKTTLIHLIDFLLLKHVAGQEHFLLKHADLFRPFVFFLEMQTARGGYVTVRRGAEAHTRAALKQHATGDNDFSGLAESEWDHWDVPIDTARQLLDGYLDLEVIKPWGYRKGVSYFLRAQSDYRDYFQIDKFAHGRDVEWKPYLAHLLGLDATLLDRKYRLEDEIQKEKEAKKERQAEVTVDERDYQKLLNEISIQKEEVERTGRRLDEFDFNEEERRLTEDLVGRVERRISEVNDQLYAVQYDLQEIQESLDNKLTFDLASVRQVFEETRTYLPEELIKDYASLVEFNRQITRERNVLLRRQVRELVVRKEALEREAATLNEQRAGALRILRERQSLQKFKALQKEHARQMAQLTAMERQRERLDEVREISRRMRELERQRDEAGELIREEIDRENPRYTAIARQFNQLVRTVLDLKGSFYLRPNANGNVEFCIETSLPGSTGRASSQGEGTSYHKLLCALFDLAILRSYSNEAFYHFVYHDGILEGLDVRKRRLVVGVLRETAKDFGIQCIISVIDADLPRDEEDNKIPFSPSEIVLRLSDSGPKGRLFRIREF